MYDLLPVVMLHSGSNLFTSAGKKISGKYKKVLDRDPDLCYTSIEPRERGSRDRKAPEGAKGGDSNVQR